jgi:hypothetical protein
MCDDSSQCQGFNNVCCAQLDPSAMTYVGTAACVAVNNCVGASQIVLCSLPSGRCPQSLTCKPSAQFGGDHGYCG